MYLIIGGINLKNKNSFVSFEGKTYSNMETIITKENIEVAIEKLCIGDTAAQYSIEECFSTSDVRFAMKTTKAIDTFITKVFEAGYCAGSLLSEIMYHNGYYMKSFRPNLLQKVDDDFLIDIADIDSNVLSFCQSAYLKQIGIDEHDPFANDKYLKEVELPF